MSSSSKSMFWKPALDAGVLTGEDKKLKSCDVSNAVEAKSELSSLVGESIVDSVPWKWESRLGSMDLRLRWPPRGMNAVSIACFDSATRLFSFSQL